MKILVTKDFERDFKRLKKKYASLPQDLAIFQKELLNNPEQGVLLANGFRKIRMAISSKGKGKSGGARVITFNYFVQQEIGQIVLVTMYDKSEMENISDSQIQKAFNTL